MLRWHFYSAPTGEWFWEVSGQEGPIAKSPPFADLEAAQADALRRGYRANTPPSGQGSNGNHQELTVHQQRRNVSRSAGDTLRRY